MRKELFCILILMTMIATPFFVLLFPLESSALPAFARKYNADCSLCHSPAVPRLNKTGQKFRWMGYRFADEVGESQDITNVGNFLAVRGRGGIAYQDKKSEISTNQFEWKDTTFFYAGALTKNLSSFTEMEIEDGKVELLSQIRALFGKPNQFTTLRFGQFHSIQGVGIGGFDRPTGISRSEIFSSKALTTSGIPFRIGESQQGIEVAHARNNARVIVQVLNGIGIGVDGTGIEGEQDREKDLLLAYEHILDDLASGFTLYGYRGVWHDGTESDDYSFYRYGAVANKIFALGSEMIGGYFRAEDRVPSAVGPNVQGNSFYLEAQHFFEPLNTTLLARFDWIDPDDRVGGNNRRKETIGVVHTFDTYLRLALEGNQLTDDTTNKTNYGLVAEAMLNF